MKDIFWTYPAEAESGKTIIVTGRDCVDTQRLSGKYPYRLSVSWDYTPLPDGMPDDADARMMEQATDLLLAETARDSAVILTGIYTGDGTRDWIFYTRSLLIFQKLLNRALSSLPELPLRIDAAEDPDWEEYLDMRARTYIPQED